MCFADALEFAAGDDIEARSLTSEEAENGQGGVRLDRVADGVMALCEGSLEELETVRDLLGRVDVERRAVFGCQGGEVDTVTVQGPVAIVEGTGGWLADCGPRCYA